MKPGANICLSFSLYTILSVSLLHAQQCPPGSAEFIPVTGGLYGKVSKSITQGPDEEVYRCACAYRNAGDAGRKISFVVNWVEKAGPSGAIGFNNLCNPNPVSIEAMEIDTKYEVHVPGKAVMATVQAAEVDIETAKSMARQFIASVESRTVRCRNATTSTVQVQQSGNASSCKQKIARLKELEQEKWVITRQIEALNRSTVTIAVARDSLSHFSKLVAAVREHEQTGRYNGSMYREVNRLQQDPVIRNYLARKYGINPDFPLLKILRTIRDYYAGQIDYLNNAHMYRSRYNKDLETIDTERGRLHAEVEQLQCPGRYAMGSCDLTGDWVITEWDSENKEKYVTNWAFVPLGNGKYTGFNKRTGTRADAEVFRHSVILKQASENRSFSLKFTLQEDCNSSILSETTTSAAFKEFAFIQRKQTGTVHFVEDMLYDISHNGIVYQGMYKKETNNGRPIDVFFFRILHPGGYQVEQDGKRLWGRFVREPALSHPDQSNVQWWFINWVFENTGWVQKEMLLKNIPGVR